MTRTRILALGTALLLLLTLLASCSKPGDAATGGSTVPTTGGNLGVHTPDDGEATAAPDTDPTAAPSADPTEGSADVTLNVTAAPTTAGATGVGVAATGTGKAGAAAQKSTAAPTSAPTVPVTPTDAVAVLNSVAPATAMRTGYAPLDAQVDAVLASIVSPGMSTHDKVKACYDYLCRFFRYERAVGNEPPVYYTSSRDELLTRYTLELLEQKQGEYEHFTAAFVVLTRALGLESYYMKGQRSDDGRNYIARTWANVRVGTLLYLFDPATDLELAKSGTAPQRFCKSDAEVSQGFSRYLYADPSADIAAFANFRKANDLRINITMGFPQNGGFIRVPHNIVTTMGGDIYQLQMEDYYKNRPADTPLTLEVDINSSNGAVVGVLRTKDGKNIGEEQSPVNRAMVFHTTVGEMKAGLRLVVREVPTALSRGRIVTATFIEKQEAQPAPTSTTTAPTTSTTKKP